MGVKATERQLKSLKRKSQKQMAQEQYPESADVIIEMQNSIEKLQKRIVKLEKLTKGQEVRIQKLWTFFVESGRGESE